MGLASGLAWLEQLLDTAPEGDAHAETVRTLAAHAEAVRDALYELYCDAADDRRLAPLVAPGTLLERQVAGSYWLVRPRGGTPRHGDQRVARAAAGPDWAAAKAEFRSRRSTTRSRSRRCGRSSWRLDVDFTSPIEPLRNLPAHLDELFAATEELQSTLATRFA